jgi:hypothetical protein
MKIPMSEQQFTLSFGALAQRLDDQLRAQGLQLSTTPLNSAPLQRDLDEVLRLLSREVITKEEATTARSRIFKRIQRSVKPLEEHNG